MLSRTSARILFVIVFALLGCIQTEASYAQGKSDEVAIVYDATWTSDCILRVQTDDGPEKAISCPAGTIIAVKFAPSSSGSADYSSSTIVGLSGDIGVDTVAIATAADDLSRSLRGSNLSASGCTAHSRTVNGSYRVNDGYRDYRVYYTMSYYLSADCSVTNVIDRARSDTGFQFDWRRSCSNGLSSSCSIRNIRIGTSFTPYYSVPNGFFDSQYVNVSRHYYYATSYYGYWYYD